MEKHVLALIDGSDYRKSVCMLAAWASTALDAPVRLLHIIDKSEPDIFFPEDIAKNINDRYRNDFIGKIDYSAISYAYLMQELGQTLLQEAEENLKKHIDVEVDSRLRYDTLTDAIKLYSKTASIIVIGKQRHQDSNSGENIDNEKNFETIARISQKPILVASKVVEPIKKFLILYDEDFEINSAFNYIREHKLLKNKSCLFCFPKDSMKTIEKNIDTFINMLNNENINDTPFLIDNDFDEDMLNKIIKDNKINLTVLSAFNQSKFKQLVFGSAREMLIQKIETPVLIIKNNG